MDGDYLHFRWNYFDQPLSASLYTGRQLLHYTRNDCNYCNVALPVPLRMMFTYAVPEELRAQSQVGCRVLVPFRKKSMIGVITEW